MAMPWDSIPPSIWAAHLGSGNLSWQPHAVSIRARQLPRAPDGLMFS